MTDNQPEQAVQATIEALIQAGTTFDLEALDRLYHPDLKVLSLDGVNVQTATKASFKSLFATKKANGDPPLNTWARIHRIDVAGDDAHVLITRRVALQDIEQELVLSIDLERNGHWQVAREVIVALESTEGAK